MRNSIDECPDKRVAAAMSVARTLLPQNFDDPVQFGNALIRYSDAACEAPELARSAPLVALLAAGMIGFAAELKSKKSEIQTTDFPA